MMAQHVGQEKDDSPSEQVPCFAAHRMNLFLYKRKCRLAFSTRSTATCSSTSTDFACHLSIYFIKVLFATFLSTLKIHDYGILKNAFFPNSGWGFEGYIHPQCSHLCFIIGATQSSNREPYSFEHKACVILATCRHHEASSGK